MTHILDTLSAQAVRAAAEANFTEKYRSLSKWDGLRLEELPGMTHVWTGVAHPLFNQVFQVRLSEGLIEASIEAAIERARVRGVPLSWWVGPQTYPADLGARLKKRGFVLKNELRLEAVRLRSRCMVLNTTGLEIEHVNDQETFKRWCRVTSEDLNLSSSEKEAWNQMYSSVALIPDDPWHHFLARVGKKPVGAATVFTGAGTACLEVLVVRPPSHFRKVARAMIYTAMRHALNRGFQVGIRLSEKREHPILALLGFQEMGKMYCYELGMDLIKETA